MFQVRVRLAANDSIELHPLLLKPRDLTPLEFDIPREATRTGTLSLSWHVEPGRGGNARGCQVAEVWLIKKKGTEFGRASRRCDQRRSATAVAAAGRAPPSPQAGRAPSGRL